MIKKKFVFSVMLCVFLFSCHQEFNNDVDPKADNYVGKPQYLGINKSVPKFPINTEVSYPAFEFLAAKKANYYGIELYDKKGLETRIPLFFQYTLKEPIKGTPFFNEENPWEIEKEEDVLWDLPFGEYYWRVCVNAQGTSNEFGAWSKLYRFNQKIRLKEMFWDYNNGTFFTVKQGFRYYFSATGDYEKKLDFIQYDVNQPLTYTDCVITNYDKKGNPLKEMGYSSIDATPNSLVWVKCYEYIFDKDKKVSVKRKKVAMENKSVLYQPVLEEEDHYFYSDSKTKQITRIERYKIDKENDNLFLFFISYFKDGKQDVTYFYYEPKENQMLKVKYFYKMYYDNIHTEKQIRAEYFMYDETAKDYFFYNNYIMKYNFENKDTNIIYLADKPVFNTKTTQLQNSDKKIHPPLFYPF